MNWLVILLTVCWSPLVWAQAPRARDLGSAHDGGGRAERDRIAKEKLLGLQFFADGKGVMLVPKLIDVYEKLRTFPLKEKEINAILRDRWGFVIEKNEPSGLFKVPYKGFDLGVLGCAACHSGRAAGVFVPGLGNKNIDVTRIGSEVEIVEKLFKKLHLKENTSPDFRQAQDLALSFAQTLAVQEIGNLTQGLVPVSIIKTWFYKQAGLPYPLHMKRGATKVPALWGYGVKRELGSFSDGFGFGTGWAVAVELTAGQSPETVRDYLPKVEEAEQIFADLLPPPYPFAIDAPRASAGKQIFERECSRCHGTYTRDEEGLPVFEKPGFVSIDVVKTDPDRTEVINTEFLQLVDSNPLGDAIQHTQFGRGYLAPRLTGVWARFPYLHNASVPTLRAMLTKPVERPAFFSLRSAGDIERFDHDAVGLTLPRKGSALYRLEEKFAHTGAREIYDTTRPGHSNLGHPFGSTLADDQKTALVEYLKSL